MHDCQRFREDWIAGSAEDFGDCEECRNFCQQAQVILQATAARLPLALLRRPSLYAIGAIGTAGASRGSATMCKRWTSGACLATDA